MQYTQIQQTPASVSHFTCSHSAEGEEEVAAAAAAVSCSAQSFGDGKGRMQRERWKRSLACFLLPASFRLPLLSNWVKRDKSEKRQAKGDVLPQESTCLVDLFLGTPCATYTISLWGDDVKQSPGCKLKSCSRFCCSSPWAPASPS